MDPSGLYERDFHYYTVFYLARAAGLGLATAGTIAGSSQYVDDSPKATISGRWGEYFNWAFGLPHQVSKSLRLHFVSDPDRPELQGLDETERLYQRLTVTPANRVVMGYVQQAIGTGSGVALGIELHALADSFSHANFIGKDHPRNPSGGMARHIGHGGTAYGGHEPDLPFLDVDKAVQASEAIYDSLVRFARTKGTNPVSNFNQLRPTLRRLFAVGAVEESDYDHDRNLELRVQAWQKLFQTDLTIVQRGFREPKDLSSSFYNKAAFARFHGEEFERRIGVVLANFSQP